MVLGIIIYLQIDRSVAADGFLMGMHIREAGSLSNWALSLVNLVKLILCGGLLLG